MNRRSFIQSLGVAVAATMLPFAKLPKLSAPKKAKPETILPYWVQTKRMCRVTDEAFRKFYESLISDSPVYQEEYQKQFARTFVYGDRYVST